MDNELHTPARTSLRSTLFLATVAGLLFLSVGVLAAMRFGLIYQAEAADEAANAVIDPSVRSEYREPVVIESKDGVLEIRLTAHQGEARLDTVPTPVRNFMVYAYDVIQGTASDGQTSGDNQYPAPTLKVDPGDKLIVHLENSLADLTIRDYYDPAFSAKDEQVPLYPPQLTQAPINLHTHGVRISPKGNSDNVMLHIGAGLSNTYVYDIREDHPQGAYWYHPHLHGLTAPQVYYGLAGMLQIGRLDGNIPLVAENDIPVRNMVLQYNYVFDRKGGLAELRNPNWPQYVSTLKPPKDDELAKGTYRPLLAPVNFTDSKKGTENLTVWYAGPLGLYNNRGRLQFMPSNLQTFTEKPDGSGYNVPADPDMPDYQRDIQFTVNGQFQPVINSKAGQTEIWVLSNISDMAYMNVQLTETETGKHPKIAILGEDGNPSPAVHYPVTNNGTRLLIPPATRYAIAVTIPKTGDLILEMPSIGDGARAFGEKGILYTNDGTDNPPARTGSVTVLPSVVSYDDGFFLFPTQVLARAVPSNGQGVTTAFVEGQELNANTGFEDISKVTPDFTRKLDVTGGFINELANKDDPKAFVYAFNGIGFPNAPLLQPRLNSVEEWKFYNYNNDGHPIHVHVNDFQVTSYFNPVTGIRTGPDMWGSDTANLPQPSQIADPSEDIAQPAELSIRTRFKDYIGLFVMHCHRLNHEDNGLMMMVNIIPAVSTYAVSVPGSSGKAAQVEIYDGNGDRLVATVTPFADYEGVPSVTMGDINGDGIYDLVVGAGKDNAPEVVVYSGKAAGGTAAFETELTRFEAFPSDAQGGISVAAAQIDGSTSDNVIVGSGPGIPSEVKVFAYKQSAATGEATTLYSSFSPYDDDQNGVSVATGFVSFTSGRNSIVTAPGPGSPAKVRVFDYWLMKPTGLRVAGSNVPLDLCTSSDGKPSMIAEFEPFGSDYRDGVSLATGWLYGSEGGAERIVVGQLTAPGRVKVYSTGSALQGGPALYLKGPVEHGELPSYITELSFMPFDGASGVHVATTSTTTGADLLVSGVLPGGKTAKIRKYDVVRPNAKAAKLKAVELGEVSSKSGSVPHILGGD
ncbi:multicopper oxidase domain-containing protein [Hoeflea sp. TYP-13]|uniref:multicopper oxidase domain-containing protein n=1 Tax=Hoeflea sp. TYP-13 TaxID=3230023 RepID=UPI0034C61522